MIEFLACSFIVLAILMAVGLFKPSVALPEFLALPFLPRFALKGIRKATDNPTRLRVLAWYSAAIFLNFLAAGIYVAVARDVPVATESSIYKQKHGAGKAPESDQQVRKAASGKFTRDQFRQPCAGAGMLAIDTVVQKELGGPIEPLLSKADRFARSFPDVEAEIHRYYYKVIRLTYDGDHREIYEKIGGDPKSESAMDLKVRIGEACLEAHGF